MPLEVTGVSKMTDRTATIRVSPGTCRVDLVDPWRMQVHPIGVTSDTEFTYSPELTPGILRLIRDVSAADEARPFAEFAGGGRSADPRVLGP